MRRLALLALLPASALAAPLPPNLAALEADLSHAQTQLKALDAKVDAAQSRHADTIAALNRNTVTLLRLRQWPEALLVAQSLADTAERPMTAAVPGLLRASARATATHLAANRRQLDDYLTLREQARQQWQTLDALASQLAAQQRHLTAQQQRALNAASLQADQLAELLESRLSQPEVSRQAPRAAAPTSARPTLTPVAGPAVPAPTGQGLHYITQPHAPVVATLPGKVMYSGPFRTMGGLVITENDKGLYAVYAGLGTLEVAVGQTLSPGARLGTMPDATQGIPTPNLYYEVRRNGRPIALQP